MTARCGGGTSSGRDGFARFVYMGPAQIGAALNNIPTPWAVAFAGAVGSITYDLSTFCTQDPPADPGMTAQDWIALLNPYTLTDSVLARSKFRDWVGHYLWDQLCKCDSGTIPTPFPVPPAPTDLPTLNPPTVGPGYPTGLPCNSYDFGTRHFFGTFTGPAVLIPVDGITYMALDIIERSRPTDPSDHYFTQATFRDASNNVVGGSIGVGFNSTADTLHAEGAIPTGAVTIRMNEGDTISSGPAMDVHTTATFYCGNTPGSGGGTVPAPCPADPFTQAMLDQILQMVMLIQRQKVPFATVPQGAVHTLSGQGSIAVDGAIGAKFTVTTIPPGSAIYEGDIDSMYEIGWFNWSGPDGATPRCWIEVSPQVSYPEGAGVFTSLSYTLRPGAVVQLQVLSREP